MILPVSLTNPNKTQFNPLSFSGKIIKPDLSKAFVRVDRFALSNPNNIVKKSFNYSVELNSRPVLPYSGPVKRTAGFSTETPLLGGGWLDGTIDTPLSTTGVRTCAVLNLVDEETAKQILYHVFHNTSADRITEFIREKFPKYTRVNLVGGDQLKTRETMMKILKAVDRVDPFAPKVYYHTLCENPQLVAYKKEIYYLEGESGRLSFIPNDKNYWY